MSSVLLPVTPAPRPAQTPSAKAPAEAPASDPEGGGFAQRLRQAREQNAQPARNAERARQQQPGLHRDAPGAQRAADAAPTEEREDSARVDGARGDKDQDDAERTTAAATPEQPAAAGAVPPDAAPVAAQGAVSVPGGDPAGPGTADADVAADAAVEGPGAAPHARPGRALGAHAGQDAPGRAVADARHEAAEQRRAAAQDEPAAAPASEHGRERAAAAGPLREQVAAVASSAAPALAAPASPADGARAPSAAAPAAAPFQAHLAAALDSPGFGPALGSQLRLLVREGIQEARLQLNPAEMGPVSVQISVEGVQARVEFRADLAATRSALESSLPDLAAALKESGLMLAGGGVFEQHRGEARAQPEQASRSGARGGRTTGEIATEVRAPLARPRGVVDLYA